MESIANEIEALPYQLKQEVFDFVEFLKNKHLKKNTPLKQREFGYAKGKVLINEDFDDPLEEFKDYM